MLENSYARKAVAGLLVISNLATGFSVWLGDYIKTFEQRLQSKFMEALSGSKCDIGGQHSHEIAVEKLLPFSQSERTMVMAPGILGWLTPFRLEGSPQLADSLLSIQQASFDMARRYTIGASLEFNFEGSKVMVAENVAVARVMPSSRASIIFVPLPNQISSVWRQATGEQTSISPRTRELAYHLFLTFLERAVASYSPPAVPRGDSLKPQPSDSLRMPKQALLMASGLHKPHGFKEKSKEAFPKQPYLPVAMGCAHLRRVRTVY